MMSEISDEFLTTLSVAERVEKLATLKGELARLALKAVALRSQVEHIESSLEKVEHPDGRDLVALYDVMGVVLPEVVVKTFEQVKGFHESITANRSVHLAESLARLREQSDEVTAEIEHLDSLRVRLLDI